jgi:flagellar biogenesis protein FliO
VRIILSAALALIATAVAHAGVKVTSLDWTENAGQGRFVVTLSAPASEVPEWDVKGGRFAMTLAGAEVEKNTVKKIAGVRLAAANTSRGVLTTLTFPQGQINADDIALTMNDGKIEITTKLPLIAQATTKAINTRAPAIVTKPQIDKKSLGEDFLKKIEAEVAAKDTVVKSESKKPVAMDFKDEIKAQQAAPKRETSFSIVGYAGKFIAFLGFVLLFFWGVIQLMKKGVLSKGKLGFLNNTQLVSVISTTYVAPKRSILMVKAHNQVFLVSSSESGMSFIAEVKDVPGIVKESEKAIVGSNFDDNVDEATTAPKQNLQEKVDIYQSVIAEEKGSVQKDIVRFSDELKKKVKNLKSLQ